MCVCVCVYLLYKFAYIFLNSEHLYISRSARVCFVIICRNSLQYFLFLIYININEKI